MLCSSSKSVRWFAALLLLPLLVITGCDSNGGGGNTDPTVSFSFEPASPTPGTEISFTADASDADGSIASYNWNFGDGDASSTDENPSYTYAAEGDYEVTLEITDNEGVTASATQTVSVGMTPVSEVVVSDDITESTTWTADNTYILDGLIFVGGNDGGGDDVTLTIEPGTVIKGLLNRNISTGDGASALIIRRGGMIDAAGTPEAPIIFTSELDDVTDPTDLLDARGNERRQLWGGLLVLGEATTNQGQTSTQIEGIPESEPAQFGGTNDDDNSGTIQYVSIRHGGFSISGQAGNEINGLTMGALGRGTTIDHVEVYANFDDGFEWFGGTVETKYLVAAFQADDGFDYDQGFRGKGQYWFSLHDSDAAGRAGEHDGGDLGGDGAEPFSIPVIANATYIGAGASVEGVQGGDNGDRAFAIRDNAGGMYYNSIVTDFPGVGVDIEDTDGPDSRARLEAGDLTFTNVIFSGFGAGDTPEDILPQAFVRDSDNFDARFVDPMLGGISRMDDGGLDPRPGAEEATSGASEIGDDSDFFDAVEYLGAFAPGEPLWTDGWTALSQNGATSS